MLVDPIVEKIRQGREEYAKCFNYDLKAIFNNLKIEERQCGFKKVVPIKRRKSTKLTDVNQIDSSEEQNQQPLAETSNRIHHRYAKTFQRLA